LIKDAKTFKLQLSENERGPSEGPRSIDAATGNVAHGNVDQKIL
jgi:hypothetical protein